MGSGLENKEDEGESVGAMGLHLVGGVYEEMSLQARPTHGQLRKESRLCSNCLNLANTCSVLTGRGIVTVLMGRERRLLEVVPGLPLSSEQSRHKSAGNRTDIFRRQLRSVPCSPRCYLGMSALPQGLIKVLFPTICNILS